MTYYRVFAIRSRVFLVRKSPATLLAKPALETGNDDFRAFRMALTDPVLSVVVLGPSEVDITTFNLADTWSSTLLSWIRGRRWRDVLQVSSSTELQTGQRLPRAPQIIVLAEIFWVSFNCLKTELGCFLFCIIDRDGALGGGSNVNPPVLCWG